MSKKILFYVCLELLFLYIISKPAYAYIGPGAGLGMLGSIIALVVAIFVAIFGIIFYPVKLLLNFFKKRGNKGEEPIKEVPVSGNNFEDQ